MRYISHLRIFKSIIKAFVTVAIVSTSVTADVDLERNLDEVDKAVDKKRARRVTFSDCCSYISATAPLPRNFKYKEQYQYKKALSIAYGGLQQKPYPVVEDEKTIPDRGTLSAAYGDLLQRLRPVVEDKKTAPAFRPFLNELLHYVGTFPLIFNMYTVSYKKSLHGRATGRKW